jgi:hypothetical protein
MQVFLALHGIVHARPSGDIPFDVIPVHVVEVGPRCDAVDLPMFVFANE